MAWLIFTIWDIYKLASRISHANTSHYQTSECLHFQPLMKFDSSCQILFHIICFSTAMPPFLSTVWFLQPPLLHVYFWFNLDYEHTSRFLQEHPQQAWKYGDASKLGGRRLSPNSCLKESNSQWESLLHSIIFSISIYKHSVLRAKITFVTHWSLFFCKEVNYMQLHL